MRSRRTSHATGIILVIMALSFVFTGRPSAQTYRDVQAGRIESLPIGMTPEEEAIRDLIGAYRTLTPPPAAQPVRAIGEYERMKGVLIRYPLGISVSIVREMAEDDIVYCVVTSSQQSAAYSAFSSGGVNMSHVVFFNHVTDSWWTRDYGPWFAYDANGELCVIDPIYNRPRPNDDAIPAAFGAFLGLDVYGPDLITAGGNWMADGRTIAASTTLVWTENPTKTHAQIAAMAHDYKGIDTYHVVPDVNGEYIQHIDCWGKFLAPDKILIRSVPTTHSQYDEIEAAVDYWEQQTSAYGWPYHVYRVYTPNNQPYTNSFILNQKVLVPITGSSWDDDAILSYQQAMPGYEVLGFTGSWESTDALHCRAKGVGDPGVLYVWSVPLRDITEAADAYPVEAQIIDYSQTGLIAGQLRVYWRAGTSGPFDYVTMTASGADLYTAAIPGQPMGTTIQYYLHAADNAGRQEDYPIVGSAGPFSFQVLVDSQDLADRAPGASGLLVESWPNPMRSTATLRFTLDRGAELRAGIYDAQGRLVYTLADGRLAPGVHARPWDGRTAAGQRVAPGVYFYRLDADGQRATRPLIVTR
jgi:agmatine/peptidylarginine deiminase